VRSSFLPSRPILTTPSIGSPGDIPCRCSRALLDGGADDEAEDAGRYLLDGAWRGRHAGDLGLLDPVDADAPGGLADPASADQIPAAGTGHEDDRFDVALGQVPGAVQVADP
jgi:hypothetical protein